MGEHPSSEMLLGPRKIWSIFFIFKLFVYANEVSWEGPKVKQEVHFYFIYTSDTARR